SGGRTSYRRSAGRYTTLWGTTQSVGKAVKEFLAHAADHMRQVGRSVDAERLDRKMTERIAETLRPDFTRRQSAEDRRTDLADDLESVLREQAEALELLQDNDRIVFTGPAGSGKTYLALEAARNFCAEGLSGYLLCYNRHLANFLRMELEDVPGVEVGTFHSIFRRLCGIQIPAAASSGWWDREFLDLASENIVFQADVARSFLIVDEAQDVLRSEYLDVLEFLVDGGFADGRIMAFGDFERQNLYAKEGVLSEFGRRSMSLARSSLSSNCRNLPRVGHAVSSFGNLEPGYKRFRRRDDGISPRYIPYANDDEAENNLLLAISELQESGFELRDIMILSPQKDALATRIKRTRLKNSMVAFPHAEGRDLAQYSTIHSFKGLEWPCVIVTDIDSRTSSEKIQDLLYIGMSRSTVRTVVWSSPFAWCKSVAT
ncbi:ATP-binding domain-containing protein, partial [Arthrobacter rhombi]